MATSVRDETLDEFLSSCTLFVVCGGVGICCCVYVSLLEVDVYGWQYRVLRVVVKKKRKMVVFMRGIGRMKISLSSG